MIINDQCGHAEFMMGMIYPASLYFTKYQEETHGSNGEGILH
jgi:hypothetical protein